MDENNKTPGEILEECRKDFSSTDFIMEPTVFKQLGRYFAAGGDPTEVVSMLSGNYQAVAPIVNVLAEWLIALGESPYAVQELVEDHLKETIIRHFDPKIADSIFMEGATPPWLAEMIEYPTWRKLFYTIADDYPDCLMLNFIIKLISDSGYQGEITSVTTTCQQVEVFSKVLSTHIVRFLTCPEIRWEKTLPDIVKIACFGEHTYLYTQLLLRTLERRNAQIASTIQRLSEELQLEARKQNINVAPLTLAVLGTPTYPRVSQAFLSMLSRNALNPADVTVLWKSYLGNHPPPVAFIRIPQILDLLVDALFKVGVKVNAEHRPKYFELLAYAASVSETYDKDGQRSSILKEDMNGTKTAIERAHHLCAKPISELLGDIPLLMQCIRYPVVATGVLRWVDSTVSDPKYFVRNLEQTPVHLVILDEISTNHPLLHEDVLKLLLRLFELPFEELDVLEQLELRRKLMDRMVHLFSCGCVTPVLCYISKCLEKQEIDVSLVRHFVTEVLDIIAPPYTAEFVQMMLPLIENNVVTGQMMLDDTDNPIKQFIAHCSEMDAALVE